MQNAGSILDRLRRVIPPGVEPKFKSAAELMAWQREEGLKRAAEVDKLNQQARAEKIFGRSGIQNLHRSCSFANYTVNGDGPRHEYGKELCAKFWNRFCEFRFHRKAGYWQKPPLSSHWKLSAETGANGADCHGSGSDPARQGLL